MEAVLIRICSVRIRRSRSMAIMEVVPVLPKCLYRARPEISSWLPALPTAWKTGSFKGLKVQGGGEVSAKWAEGKMTEAGLKAVVPGTFRIKLPAESSNMSIKMNQKPASLPVIDGMLTVEMEAGDSLLLQF